MNLKMVSLISNDLGGVRFMGAMRARMSGGSHYGSFEARRVMAPGLHRPQNRLLVGRVTSPGGPVWCHNENCCMNARSLNSARTKSIARVEKFRAAYSDGATKATWNAGVGDDGRYLLHGRETWFFEDQKKLYEADYDLGRKVGTETLWRRDGSIAWQWLHNADGTSQWTQYWDNARKRAESKWRNFHADGPAKLWDRPGQLLSQVNFANGVKQ